MPPIDRKRTPGAGKTYWRSLDELSDSPEFRRFVEREFPAYADEMLAPTSRRNFLKVMGASMALAGMTGCRWPTEEILPFTQRPDGYTPGVPMRYATAMDLRGSATGLLVTSYDGRPIKIEGNPLHPQSLGASGTWQQAAVLELYDPDRTPYVVRNDDGRETNTDWPEFERFARQRFDAAAADEGAGLRVLCGANSSPSLRAMRARLLKRFPAARWVEYEPFSRDNERDGTQLAFGAALRPHPAFDRAETIVSLDEDFLHQHPTALRNARDWARGRDPETDRRPLLVVYESAWSLTGAAADRRVALRPSELTRVAGFLAARLFLESGLELPRGAGSLRAELERFRTDPRYSQTDLSVADDLLRHRGNSLLLAGPRQPAEVHALVHLVNLGLGNAGRTVRYTADPDPDRPPHLAAIRRLSAEIDEGRVQTLLILGGNPVFDAPADLEFASRLARVEASIHLGLHKNETARACSWHLPEAHFLECWGDARGHEGHFGVAQPLIEPLFDGRSAIEVLATFLGDEQRKGHEIVRRTFDALPSSGGSDAAWRRVLHDGLLPGSAWPEVRPDAATPEWAGRLAASLSAVAEDPELVFLEDAGVLDGRFANNGWLMELPDPLTKLSWDNAALIAPATAEALGVRQAEMIALSSGDRTIELPVFIVPGQAEGSIATHAGFGRRHCGRVGDGVGFDVYPLRTSERAAWMPVRVESLGRSYKLATTQDHFAIDELGATEIARRAHELVREVDPDEFRRDPEAAVHRGHPYHPVELWKEHEYEGHRWGMAIDLNACIGCNGCVVACQAENNIPVVGKDEIATGREMHWIRVDRYYSGDPEQPGMAHQPLTCHHCENAPCEQVCPVAATVHDDEGLNVMVYNRCIGTRYCSNNCPYKVRRFNYFNNRKNEHTLEMMVYNPEVTVRSRGVMEKCTFCVQRISAAKIEAKNDDRELQDGQVTTACQQACPTQAIAFGDLNDPESRVRHAHESARSYTLLEEINVKPRTRYLARVRKRGSGGDPGSSGHSGNA